MIDLRKSFPDFVVIHFPPTRASRDRRIRQKYRRSSKSLNISFAGMQFRVWKKHVAACYSRINIAEEERDSIFFEKEKKFEKFFPIRSPYNEKKSIRSAYQLIRDVTRNYMSTIAETFLFSRTFLVSRNLNKKTSDFIHKRARRTSEEISCDQRSYDNFHNNKHFSLSH